MCFMRQISFNNDGDGDYHHYHDDDIADGGGDDDNYISNNRVDQLHFFFSFLIFFFLFCSRSKKLLYVKILRPLNMCIFDALLLLVLNNIHYGRNNRKVDEHQDLYCELLLFVLK